MMDHSIDYLLQEIHERSQQLSESERRQLALLLKGVIKVIDAADDGARSRDFVRVANYLARLRKPTASSRQAASSKQLLDIARTSGHSKWRFSKEDLRSLQSQFWKVLVQNAEVWPPDELANLLSYSLKQKPHDSSHLSSEAVARMFHSDFKKLSPNQRDELFEELLQRTMSEPQFRKSLADRAHKE